jgi:glycosyltransferase involved in cell wall biosynthesis
MRIVILASYPYSLINFRGPLIRDMVAAGHEVIACAPGEDAEIAAALTRLGASYRAVSLSRTGLNPIADARSLLELVWLLRRLRPDLLFAYTAKPVIYGSVAARLARVPRLYTMITGLGYTFTDGREWKRRLLRRISISLYRHTLRFSHGIFFQNQDDIDEFIRRSIITIKDNFIKVDGSGVDIEHYYSSAPDISQISFLMIARLIKDKGIYEYAEAAKAIKSRYPQVKFHLLGRHDSNPNAVPKDRLACWIADDTIDYLGVTSDVRPHIKRATVYVLPSYYREGIPRTVLEALTMGRAVITTDTPGCRETVLPGVNGFLVPPRDAGALAAAMERFVRQPELAVEMGRESRALAERRFDVRGVNAAMLKAMNLR